MISTILCITGPTAVGKTDFFLKLLSAGYPFEAVVADSRQIYQYMDIGTGKDLPSDPVLKSKFWLVDLIPPDQNFSSANFRHLANQAIHKIINSGHLPVVIGGTGRYIKDLESAPVTLNIPPEPELRKKLASCSKQELQSLLQQTNSHRFAQMNNSDKNNPRRLLRAIEVTGKKARISDSSPKYQFHTIVLTAPLELIKTRIKARVNKRINQGIIQEVETLLTRYPQFSDYQSCHTPGYQEMIQFVNHQLTLDQATKLWAKREIAYAKRQLTWARHQTQAVWFDITHPNWYADAVTQLEEWDYVTHHSQN